MAPLFVDPGLLRHRAILERPVETDDGAGGAVVAWEEAGELSVHVDPVGARGRERFDRREAEVTHRVLCRRRPGIERGRRFRLAARTLAILTVHDPDESGRWLLCRCAEEA